MAAPSFKAVTSVVNKALFILALMCSCRIFAASAPIAINVQAALIKNFTHLIEWPALPLSAARSDFVICVYGPKTLQQQFKQLFSSKVMKGRKTHVKALSSTNLDKCDLVYVAASAQDVLTPILKSARENRILTVSANSGYGELGFHINFYLKQDKIAFELNKRMLDSAGFQVSTQIYRYARIVK